jgi:hypothetical protein
VLQAPIPAGTWHLIGDGESISGPVTERFDILWRSGAGDTMLATATNAFAPLPSPHQFDAVPFETDVTGTAAAAAPGDKLVLRFTTVAGGFYTPNGDGALVNGRYPSLTLPTP